MIPIKDVKEYLCLVSRNSFKQKLAITFLFTVCFLSSYGQEKKPNICSASCTMKCVEVCMDSTKVYNLSEVLIIAPKKKLAYQRQSKPLSSVDEYLEKAQQVTMIKRGAYAWEPNVNNMATERLSVTIDGMRIFAACTDKMDPITSYVDVSNLSKVVVSSGQEGSEQGNCIGGAVDLKLDKTGFKEDFFRVSLEDGFESSNEQKIIGADINFSDEKFYVDADIIYRDAENYTAGGGEEVLYSQFTKYNLSFNGGLLLDEDKKLSATFIFDEARDVGYPALPMDVSLARGIIGAVTYEQASLGKLNNWESKLYANSITHIMDDSQRPDVPIRMDMPGWSDTYGFYSQAGLTKEKHQFLFKADGFYNRSLAEMTMYPADVNQSPMFMLTWPDVRTLNTGVYVEDNIAFAKAELKLATRLSFQNNFVADDFGLNSLQIFYPDMEASQNRFLSSVSALYSKKVKAFDISVGASYATRAPSVSEGFGFYLFNSTDNHDYIGNPELNNEQAIEFNGAVSYKTKKFNIGLSGNIFRMPNYIIGEVEQGLSTMTIGADGVKIYRNLDNATISNLYFNTEYKISKHLKWNGGISYHRGTDSDNRNLPFISPVAYGVALNYHKGTFTAGVDMQGATKQIHFNPIFGENQTDAYTVFGLSMGKTFHISKNTFYVKAGVQNIFDRFYSTYADWNNIPRIGRNVHFTLSYKIG